MKIYVSGPMSNLPEHNIPAFNKAAKALRKKGYDVVNPAELDGDEPCSTWEECLRRDIRHLTYCTDIATLPGWANSRGALLELHIGNALGFEVHTVGHYLKRRKK